MKNMSMQSQTAIDPEETLRSLEELSKWKKDLEELDELFKWEIDSKALEEMLKLKWEEEGKKRKAELLPREKC